MRITNQELDSEILGLRTDDERLSVRGQALLDLRDERFDRQKLKIKLLRIEKDLAEVKRRSTRRAIQTTDLLKTVVKMRVQRDDYAAELDVANQTGRDFELLQEKYNKLCKAFQKDVDGKHYYIYHGEVALEDVGITVLEGGGERGSDYRDAVCGVFKDDRPAHDCIICHGENSEHCDNCKNMEGMPGTKPPALKIDCMHQGHNFALGPCPACGMDFGKLR